MNVCVYVSMWVSEGGAVCVCVLHTLRPNIWLRTGVALILTKTPLYPRHSALTFDTTRACTHTHTQTGRARVSKLRFHVLSCLNALLTDTFLICQHSIWCCMGVSNRTAPPLISLMRVKGGWSPWQPPFTSNVHLDLQLNQQHLPSFALVFPSLHRKMEEEDGEREREENFLPRPAFGQSAGVCGLCSWQGKMICREAVLNPGMQHS